MNYDSDVAIVGAGPAGLSAALVLGRCRRHVLVFDHGQPRNRDAVALHGYLGLDGIAPQELRNRGRKEAVPYGITFVDQEVTSVSCNPTGGVEPVGFEVTAAQRVIRVRKLLLATGVSDEIPPIENIREFYGLSVHHCPYCDGWEHRDQRLVALGDGSSAVGLAVGLKSWSAGVTACTNGRSCSAADLERLDRNGIVHRPETIVRLEGTSGMVRQIVFAAGAPLPCDAVFFQSSQVQRSPLPAMAGCRIDERSHVETKRKQSTGVRGLYLAGDADGDVQLAVVAAAEGAIAATAIHRELQDEDEGSPT